MTPLYVCQEYLVGLCHRGIWSVLAAVLWVIRIMINEHCKLMENLAKLHLRERSSIKLCDHLLVPILCSQAREVLTWVYSVMQNLLCYPSLG